MLSSRRVKKGPGHRPQSAKRHKFLELRERGWSFRAAAREVGVSQSSATNRATGFNVYRNGKILWFMPPLNKLLKRQTDARFLWQDERVEIAGLRLKALSVRQIAHALRRAPSTISRELVHQRCNPQRICLSEAVCTYKRDGSRVTRRAVLRRRTYPPSQRTRHNIERSGDRFE